MSAPTTTETALATIENAETSLQPTTLAQLKAFADTFAVSQLLPTHLRNKPADVAITVLYGRELGLTPMQAIQGIFVIEGKPGVSAATAVALVKRSPLCEYFTCIESTEKRAVYETKRRGEPQPTRLSFTIEEAGRAELATKGTWKKYPAAMLRNRAAMQLARDVYPDVVANIVDHDEADELGAPAAGGMVAPPPPAFQAPAGTLEATATPVPAVTPAKPLLERLSTAPTLEALVDLAAECKASPPAEQDALRAAYAHRKATLGLAAAKSTAPAEPPAPAVSKNWGDILDAGAKADGVQAEREPGQDDD